MAQAQENQRDRLWRHVLKKLRTTIHGLRPSAVVGRVNGPRVLLNSIPKAGTHLLESMLEQLPGFRNAGHRTVSVSSGATYVRAARSISSIRRGQFLNSHLAYDEMVDAALVQRETKMLFVVRDPRDIAISRFRYVTEIDLLHPASKAMRELPNNEARIAAAIEGIPGSMPSMAEALEGFSPWLKHSCACTVKFESLVGARGGGSDEESLATLARVCDFLELSVGDSALRAAAQVSGQAGSTFRRGQVGTWTEEFSASNRALAKSAFERWVIGYGYEPDLNDEKNRALSRALD